MKGYTVLQILEAEAKTRALRDAATLSLDAFAMVGQFSKLTAEQTELRVSIEGDRDTHLLCLTLLGEEIDRLDNEAGFEPGTSKPLKDTPRAKLAQSMGVTSWEAEHGTLAEWHHYNSVDCEGSFAQAVSRHEAMGRPVNANTLGNPLQDTPRARLARDCSVNEWVDKHGSASEWHEYQKGGGNDAGSISEG